MGSAKMIRVEDKAPQVKSHRNKQTHVKKIQEDELEISRKISSPNADEMTSSDTHVWGFAKLF